ncbi:hypothetical protein D3C83_234670 [compost metagenome]
MGQRLRGEVAGDDLCGRQFADELLRQATRLAAVAEDAGVEVQDGLHDWLLSS